MDSNLIIFNIFGGVMLLLFGVKLAGEGLKDWAGERIKSGLETMTKNRFSALLTGIVITFFLQSSSAATVTLVSLIDSGLMSFTQSLAVILGSGVGTTITVQLISFDIQKYSILICGLGLFFMFISKDHRKKSAGQGVLGFGLILLAIMLMSQSMAGVKESELLMENIKAISEHPFLAILIATLITAVIQSSAATIGIAITLCMNGMMDIHAAIPIILGANIGTCATAMISGANSSIEAKRAAIANVAFKIIGVMIFLPFISIFADLMEMSSTDSARQVANAHTVFNLTTAVLFLPFVSVFGKVIKSWFPDTVNDVDEFKAKHLHPYMLKSASLAIAQATRETMRMAEIVQDMMRISLIAIRECETEVIGRVEDMDDKADYLDSAIRRYLTQMSNANMTPVEAEKQMHLLGVISNLETIGDVIDTNLMEQCRKKGKLCVQFSKEGIKDIEALHIKVMENMEMAISAFTSGDRALAEKVYRNKPRIKEVERGFYRRHIERLESGLAESLETSSIHLDILTNLLRINSHVTNIVIPMVTKPHDEQTI
jgi:phosphate:Na+ symporter